DGKRSIWAKNRWSKDGINNQTSEGTQRSIKYSFLASYSYFKPENSQLYLNEYSALKAIRVYGLDELIRVYGKSKSKPRSLRLQKLGNVEERYWNGSSSPIIHQNSKFLLKTIDSLKYSLPTLNKRMRRDSSNSWTKIDTKLKSILEKNEMFELKQAYLDYLEFMLSGPKQRRSKERFYSSIAYMMWNNLSFNSHIPLSDIEIDQIYNQNAPLRIARRWAKLGIADVKFYKSGRNDKVNFHVKKLMPVLPDILYTFDFENRNKAFENSDKIQIVVKESNRGGRSKYGMTKKEREERIRIFNEKEK
ncbi:hypothetical protein LEP1GSC052_0064, partial [Leptospira phage vb_LkmZ_Bejolso9-LE1]